MEDNKEKQINVIINEITVSKTEIRETKIFNSVLIINHTKKKPT